MNKNKRNHLHNRGGVRRSKHSYHSFGKRTQFNWLFWLVIILLLIAIIVYRMSFSLGWGSHR